METDSSVKSCPLVCESRNMAQRKGMREDYEVIRNSLDEAKALGYNDLVHDIQQKIEMRKRNDLLNLHKFAITEIKERNKAGKEIVRWRTNLPNEEGKKGKQIKKSTRQALEDALVQFYTEREKKGIPTFDNVYHEWVEYHHKLNNSSGNTIDKYQTDYFRFIKDAPFAQRIITEIRDTDIEEFFIELISSYVGRFGEKGLEYKSFGRLYGYFSGTFKYAYKHRIISENPMRYLDKADFKNACKDISQKTAETELIPDNLFDRLLDQIYEDIKDKPTNFTFYAVELAAKTGMRVAEVATLKWTDIDYDKGVIFINRSDKYNKERNTESGLITRRFWTIEGTKTKRGRYFPIDTYILTSLNRIRKAQMQYGCVSEWLFPHPEYGWCHSSLISSCIKNKCRQLGFERTYGIHALRKTLNSDMRNNNASDKMCASMIGNSIEVNNRYYYYDNSDMEDKRSFVESAHRKRRYA